MGGVALGRSNPDEPYVGGEPYASLSRRRLDKETRREGFRGYVGCPADDCPTPYMCSERGDCPAVLSPEETQQP